MPMNRIPDEATSYYYDMSGSDMVGEPITFYNTLGGQQVVYQNMFDAGNGEAVANGQAETAASSTAPVQRSLFDCVDSQPQAEGTTDRQGNPTDGDGRLITEGIGSIDELTDEDFISPTRSVTLPQIPTVIDRAIGANGKPVVIKKNIFEKNRKDHPDVTPEQSREILSAALYDADLYGQNKPQSKPYNWVVINTKDKEGNNRLVLLEVNETKDNVEVIHWHYIRDNALETLKRQAQREDGQLLILPSETSEEAGALSGPTQGLSSESKSTQNSDNSQTNGEKIQKRPVVLRRTG